MSFTPIAMTEEYWANSQFSIARYYGEIRLNGYTYTIVNEDGIDIFELSRKAAREGREKAIEPGKPCDLVRNDWIPVYRAVGRNKFSEIVKQTSDLKEAYRLAGIPYKKKRAKK